MSSCGAVILSPIWDANGQLIGAGIFLCRLDHHEGRPRRQSGASFSLCLLPPTPRGRHFPKLCDSFSCIASWFRSKKGFPCPHESRVRSARRQYGRR